LGLKFAILGYYGFGNAGDEAVLDGILTALNAAAAKKGIEIKITVLSSDPETTRKSHNVDAAGRSSLKSILSVLRKTDVFILGGGSLFQDTTGRGLSVLYYAGISIMAKILCKKVIFYAQGVGPLKRSINRALTAISARSTDLLSVRDSASLLLLSNLHVNAHSIHLTSDPAFALLPDRDSFSYLEALGKLPDKPILGVMMRDWPGIGDVLGEIAQACEMLAKECGLSIVLVPMQKSHDMEVCKRLSHILKTESIIIDEDLSPTGMIALFERFSLVLGMRLHALIFAAIAGAPMLGIGYDPKINAFLAQIGMPLSADTAQASAQELTEQGLRIWKDRGNIRERLLEKSKGLRDGAFSFADSVFEAFVGRMMIRESELRSEKFLGLEAAVTSMSQIVSLVEDKLESGTKAFTIASVNPEICVAARKNEDLKKALSGFSIGIPDGIGIVIASRLKGGKIRERVTGIDLMLKLCAMAANAGFSVFLLGASPGVAEDAGAKLAEKFPGIVIAGTRHGYFKEHEEGFIAEIIKKSKADIVFVGLGSPRQELFIYRNKDLTGACVLMAVGGSFDVISGNLKRAPDIYMRLGIEWLYRTLKQPERAFRLLKLPQFLGLVLWERLAGKGS